MTDPSDDRSPLLTGDSPGAGGNGGGRSGRGPIAWMAGNSVAANLIMLLCLVGGFIALWNMQQEFFPDFDVDAVMVSVPYPGASPEEVEKGIVLAIEEAVQGLEDVDEVTSVASEGSARVTIELVDGADVQRAAGDIESEVDRITTLPPEAEEPEVRVMAHERGVLTIVLHGQASTHVLHTLAEQLRDELIQDPDVTRVDVEGAADLEIAVEVPQEELRRYGLTMADVAETIGSAALDVPAGGLDTPSGEVLVRLKARRDWGQEFAQLPIVTPPGGGVVRLGDIARVKDGFEDTDRYARYDGEPAMMLEVYRVGKQTPVQVSEAVHKVLDAFGPSLPAGIEADVLNDRAQYYKERVRLLLKNGSIGLGLVLLVLGLFLEARLAFWVMLGIPVSFLGSFLLLPATGVTINMISLFAYIIALGIVVDDAIVVGENIYRYRQEGMGLLRASVRGAREVAMPVTFSILTNIVAFLPIYFIPGVPGQIFRSIPLVVCTVFTISLIESLFVLPAHLSHSGRPQRHGLGLWLHARQQAFSDAFRHWVRHRYGRFLEQALRHRYLTFALAASLLAVMSAYALSGRLGMQLMPVAESDRAEARVTLPYGAAVEKTEAVLHRLEAGARRVIEECGHPELLKSILTNVGDGGSHAGRVRVTLAEAEIRDKIMSTAKFTERWRKAVGEVTGVDSLRFLADARGPGGRGRPVAVELSHRSMDVLERASARLAATLQTYPRAQDVDDGFQPGKPQFDVVLTPAGRSLGLTGREVSRQIRNALYGAEALSQQRGRNELEVRVRLPEHERASEQTLQDLMIRTPAGTFVPLPEVAETTRGRAYKTIDRRNGRRVVQVSADVTPRAAAGEILADLRQNELPTLLGDHPGLTYSFEGHHAEISESMGTLVVTFALALLAMYALLAVPFRSYVQPLIVMISIPFGVIGAFLGHLIMGYSLCVPSMFGIVALAGVVVNDSLVLVDFANRRRREGAGRHDAIWQAAIQRFRPVLLTTLTTFGGLAPMIFERSFQARMLIPMALSLGYGILFATGITLILVPSLYLATEDVERAAGRLRDRLRKGRPVRAPADTEPA